MKQLLVGAMPLVARMLAKSPAEGYRLWFDVLATDERYIYIAEAPAPALETQAQFRGVRITLDTATGKPLGKVGVADGFAWNLRADADWT